MSCRLFLTFAFLSLSFSLFADGPVSVIYVDSEDYRRHPRMEEEDRLRGRTFHFAPGLEIISDVDDALIRIAGERVGRTPWESEDLAPGLYRVSLEKTGYPLMEFSLTIRNGWRTVVTITMGEAVGYLVPSQLPPGAELFIDGRRVQGNPVRVPAGRHELLVSAFGWEDSKDVLTITAGEETHWQYGGSAVQFALVSSRVSPPSLPADDNRGFRVQWKAAAAGTATLSIVGPDGHEHMNETVDITSARGSMIWKPSSPDGEEILEGVYAVTLNGRGADGNTSSIETRLSVDNRFDRNPRPGFASLPGLVYAPGTAMLPPGVWQVSTGLGVAWGADSSSQSLIFPVRAMVRFSPMARWEFTVKFAALPRIPFDTTSFGISALASWRITPSSGIFNANLALMYSHEGYSSAFGRIPVSYIDPLLPGIFLAAPMEVILGPLTAVASPAMQVNFIGQDALDWYLSVPVQFSGLVSLGLYYEHSRFLVGVSTALRSPLIPGNFQGWTLWTALEGRFDFPRDSFYIALHAGLRALPGAPLWRMGLDFGIIP